MVKIEIGPSDDGGIRATLAGKIDEKFDGHQILQAAQPGQRVTLRLDGVRGISSLGVRALESFMVQLGEREVVLEDISAAVANQVTMIPNLLGRATVQVGQAAVRLPELRHRRGAQHSVRQPEPPPRTRRHAARAGPRWNSTASPKNIYRIMDAISL